MFKEMPMKMLSFYVLFKLKSKRFLFLMTSIFIMWLSCNIINSRIPKQKISPSIHVQCAGNKDEGYKMMKKTFFFFAMFTVPMNLHCASYYAMFALASLPQEPVTFFI